MSTQSPHHTKGDLLLATGEIASFITMICSVALQQWHTLCLVSICCPDCPTIFFFLALLYLCSTFIKLQISSSVHLHCTTETPSDKRKCPDETQQPKENNKKTSNSICFFPWFFHALVLYWSPCGLGVSCPLFCSH